MDEKFMSLALSLAKKGIGQVNPNPLVGAVIVKNNKVISSGYHEKFGENHAEINAINSAKENLKDSTIYVTLEPCCHSGKTPPCVKALIKHKFKKVVIGTLDPNPLVSGKSVKILKDANIDVVVGVLEEECKNLNEKFNKFITSKLPFVTMKYAMTLDGKIATYTNDSKWISCETSRKYVQNLRNENSGIMVGINTILKDNPSLNCRINDFKSPIRIIIDSTLKIPLNAKVLNLNDNVKTIIATTKFKDKNKEKLLIEKFKSNVEILQCNDKNKKVDLKDLMIKLGEKNIDSILLEGGATLNYSALEEKIVDKILSFISPKIIGGTNSLSAIGGQGKALIKDGFILKNLSFKKIDKDILVEGYLGGE